MANSTTSDPILLGDRGVLRVGGPQCEAFLQDLLSNDATNLAADEGAYAALLTPQGKILFDMIIIMTTAENGARAFLLDCAREQADDLAKRLGFYKLRAKVTIEDRSDHLAALASFGGKPQVEGIVVRDPRSAALGYRAYLPRDKAGPVETDTSAYEARRIQVGVPKGGVDFLYGDAFPHEANFDLINGVDFKKGCYIGQEVVSRMQHRGTVRKRIVKVAFSGEAPAVGTEIKAGETLIGTMGSSAGGHGLAMVRLDRLEDAKAVGITPIAAGARLDIEAEMDRAPDD
ncbi:MAG: folate-binding protein YgfZ [Methylobacteriaceae bacterium]|nr:folate-binding protein YgfZ [Methylobacteriaceae bacterium]